MVEPWVVMLVFAGACSFGYPIGCLIGLCILKRRQNRERAGRG